MNEPDWADDEPTPAAADANSAPGQGAPEDPSKAVSRLRERAAEHAQATRDATPPLEPDEAASDEPEDEDPQTFFPSCYHWFDQWLVPTWTRPLAGSSSVTWCPQWWRHPEAVSRIESLWRAWEQLRLDPGTGMSVWWRDHADHHLPVLLAFDGPFKGCSEENGHTTRPTPPLPAEAPPGELTQA